MRASESYPGGFSTFEPEHFHDSSLQYAKPPSLAASPMSSIAEWTINSLPSDLQSLFRTNVIRTWMDVIEHYARRGLTKKKDKLPAISAIARKAHTVQKCDYLAGLWKNDLAYELGWMSDFGELLSETPQGSDAEECDDIIRNKKPHYVKALYRAPTWSWASVDGRVTFPYNNDNIGTRNNHPLIEYIGHEIELNNANDLYGEVIGGYLTVKAQIIEVTLSELDSGGVQLTSQSTQVSVSGHVVSTQGNVCREDLNGKLGPDLHNVLAVPLLLSFSLSSGFFLTCLLLEKEQEQNIYKRVGALNWQSERAKLESDFGLKHIMRQLGEIEWDAEPFIRFEPEKLRLQEIKIV